MRVATRNRNWCAKTVVAGRRCSPPAAKPLGPLQLRRAAVVECSAPRRCMQPAAGKIYKLDRKWASPHHAPDPPGAAACRAIQTVSRRLACSRRGGMVESMRGAFLLRALIEAAPRLDVPFQHPDHRL